MNKLLSVFALGVLAVFFVSFVSAGSINFTNGLNPVYNYGDNINATLTVSPVGVFNNVVSMYLDCSGNRVEVYKEFISTDSPMQKTVIVPIVSSFIGNISGTCDLQAYVENDSSAVSKSFGITRNINVDISNWQASATPGKEVNLTGSAIKQDGKYVNGFYTASMGNYSVNGDVKNGEFTLDFSLPENFPSGSQKFIVNVSDEDSAGNIMNSGSKMYFLSVEQVPTSVEVLLDSSKVMPGKDINGKIILHDQTGKSIPGVDTYIAIKDSAGNMMDKITAKTDSDFSYAVNSTQAPAEFTISAYSDGLINNAYVDILKNLKVESSISNNTLTITNVGNVPYNQTLVVKVGKDNVSLPLSLGVGMSEQYQISAPNGEYNVSVGDVQRTVTLSGNAVAVQKISGGASNVNILLWLALIIILALGLYLIIKRNYKKKFILHRKKSKGAREDFVPIAGHVTSHHEEPSKKISEPVESLAPGRKAEISLSISGTKQDSAVGCIMIKNYPEISSGAGNVKETLSKVASTISGAGGFTYQNGNYIFFVLAPSFTRTFQNQKTAVDVSKKIKEILDNHNRKFNVKIEYGISLNYGPIIAKQEKSSIKFMSLGTLMISAKKIAGSSDGDITVSDKFKEKLDETFRGSAVNVGGVKAYKLGDFVDKDKHSTFISGFLARQEKERQKAEEKKTVSGNKPAEKPEEKENPNEGMESLF